MAKLPDENVLGGIPQVRVPYGTPRIDMLPVLRGYQNLGTGFEKLAAGIQGFKDRQTALQVAQADADVKIGHQHLWENQDTTQPQDFINLVPQAANRIDDPEAKALFLAKHAPNADMLSFKFGAQKTLEANDVRLEDLARDSVLHPERAHDNLVTARGVIDSEANAHYTSRPQAIARSRKWISGVANGVMELKLRSDPDGFLKELDDWQKSLPNSTQTPGVSGGIDRSQFRSEIEQNPDLVARMASMVKGEVGLGDTNKATIQLETLFNRAQVRGIPLDEALLSIADDKKRGYYASDTYRRPATSQEIADFQQRILAPVLSGSDKGSEFLGAPPTGNASRMDFAGRRLAEGRYAKGEWYSGQPGVGEMFVLEKADAAGAATLPRLGEKYASRGDVTNDASPAPDSNGPDLPASDSGSDTAATNAKISSPLAGSLASNSLFQFVDPAKLSLMKQQALYNRQMINLKSDDWEVEQQKKYLKDPSSVTPMDMLNAVRTTSNPQGPATREAAERMIRMITRGDDNIDPAASHRLAADLLTRHRLPPGDPNRISNLSQIEPYYVHLKNGDFNLLSQVILNDRSADGQRKEDQIKKLVTAVSDRLDPPGNNMPVSNGKLAVYEFEHDLRAQIDGYDAHGLDWRDLLDPSAPDFFGRDTNLRNYQPSLQAGLSASLDSLRKQRTLPVPVPRPPEAGSTPPASPTPQPPSASTPAVPLGTPHDPNESPEDYLRRVRTGTGN